MTGQQLKNSILQMAVQGKLVPQDPNDEPASVLLERIRAEKEQLIKEGKLKKEKNPSVIFRGADNLPYEKVGKNEPVCIADEVPFDIPESWEWTRIGNVFQINPRNNLPDELETGFVPMALLSDGFCSRHSYEPKKWKDIKNGFTHFANNDIVIAKITPCFQNRKSAVVTGLPNGFGAGTTELHVLRDNTKELFMPYFLLICKTQAFIQNGVKNFSGTAGQQRIGKDFISKYLIPVPPVSEQERIVQRLHLLEPLLISYENAYDSIVNQQKNFPAQLKRSILQYAVQGKLVSQNPADEPAAILLEHIRAEKEKLIKSGKIKRDKHESFIFRRDNSYYEKVDGIERCIDDELPFEIPESWKWCRLKSLTENITSGSRDWAKYYSTTGAAFLRMGNLSKNSFDLRLEHIQRVSIPSKAEGTRTSLQSGDLLFSITGDVGMLGLIPDGFEKAYINQHTAMIRFLPEMRNKYIPYLLLTDYAQKFYNVNQHGIKNSFRLDSIGELLVSIPPEKELFRILQRISLVLSKIAVL